ncbi:DNA mismatch repair protein MutS [Longibacter salinarum]|uniref:DNA mismatch repair protein MutS n=1 Tax=Longibacter salinarum TaxID=1850348 RepID=A0A2A8CXW3_9BACT|nr:Smr/MutS family protein [Longibacter salinarum]PEN13535.1 DNA mismatch repair protein MutS [Longibacter salinarum]
MEPDPQEYPVDGVLDLHVFEPSDIGELVPEYLRVCREKDILRVRIIHGKGTGQLRRSVHAILDRTDAVTRYETAKDASSWGATIAFLKPEDEEA